MPVPSVSDEEVLVVLVKAGRALTVNQILRELNDIAGQKGALSRATLIVHLRNLIDNRQVVRLCLADAIDYGGVCPHKTPKIAFYITVSHRRDWDAQRLGQQLPILVAADAIPPPDAGLRLISAIQHLRGDVSGETMSLADRIRSRIAGLTVELDRARPLRPEHAVMVRDGMGWLLSLAADLEAAAGLAGVADEPTSVLTGPKRLDGRSLTKAEQIDPGREFRNGVWHAWETMIPEDKAEQHPLGSYVLGPGFLESVQAQERVSRMSVVRMVVRVLADCPAAESRRRPRPVREFTSSGGDTRNPAGLWSAVITHVRTSEMLLVWRVRVDNVIELVEVAQPHQVTMS
jgi:hypothetical protein